MTPRAPIVTACRRINGRFNFYGRPLVRRNPATQRQILDLYDAVQRIYGKRYASFSNKEDLVAAAVEGVVKAARDFDPSRGAEWRAYALSNAQFAVDAVLREEGGGRGRVEKRTELQKLEKAFMREFQKRPSAADLAQFSGRSLDEIYDLQRDAASGTTVSSSQSIMGGEAEEGDTKLEDTLSAGSAQQVQEAQETVIEAGRRAERVKELTPMEKMFDGYMQKGKSISWIAKKIGIGETKAREIAKGLRAHLAPPDEG